MDWKILLRGLAPTLALTMLLLLGPVSADEHDHRVSYFVVLY